LKGAIDVSGYSEEELKKNSVTTPKMAAETIVSGMEADKWKIIVGKDCKQMDWLVRIAPRFAMKKLAEAIKKLHQM
jgi:short-subunit dehydrogenase